MVFTFILRSGERRAKCLRQSWEAGGESGAVEGKVDAD